ncbi:MAG: 50S ribosomal protein L29 [bacterium]
MKQNELKNLTIKELNNLLEEKRIQLAKLKIEIKRGTDNKVHLLSSSKKEVARILTELNIRRLS